MTRRAPLGCVALLLSLAACGSVEVPRERFYRLDLPAPMPADPQRAGVLRVQDLQLGTAIDSDCLLVADGVRLEPRPLDRWVAPLDRLVTDALVLGLSRSGVVELVKGSADPGSETWSLHGRIVDFAEANAGSQRQARVALELWLEQRDQVLFRDEFVVVEQVEGNATSAAVTAFSKGVQTIVDQLVTRMDHDGVLAAARPPVPSR
ncbi:MAG: membrane integrity-associated transporter subunit PqiC [Planctomycetes bacterium]|nr:membrane integrity-associated transporter subunit PqiC [Planctomycetota bacterium]